MPLRKHLIICMLAMIVTSASPAVSDDEPIKFRYYAPYGEKGSVYKHFAGGGSAKGYKLCTTPSWKPEYSAKPEDAKGFVVVRVPARDVLAKATGVCDVGALRVLPKKGITESVLDKRAKQLGLGHIPIPSLNVK